MSVTANTLLILGAGGHGRVVADAAQASGWRDIVFLDDRFPTLSASGPWRVIGGFDALASMSLRSFSAALGIGANRTRLVQLARLRAAGIACPAIVHPAASVSAHAIIGEASVIFAGAVVNVGATLGAACIVNSGSIVEHDCTLADGVHVSPRAALAGGVAVGARSWIGIGASVIQTLSIGCDVVVGAGAAVVSDLPDGVTALGVPARIRCSSPT